jgi:hypothetical protein
VEPLIPQVSSTAVTDTPTQPPARKWWQHRWSVAAIGALGLLVGAGAGIAASAWASAASRQYVLKHPKHEHCKAQYIKKAETVKRRGEHGRAMKVRETLCVYVAPAKAPIMTTTRPATVSIPMIPTPTTQAPTPTPTPSPSPPAPTRTVTLHTHLSFAQSQTNPAAVTYHYSASATVGSEDEPNLPAGVLNLYSEGLLKCSVNVGGSIIGGECQVVYSDYGTHTVVLTYSSGSTSVTETYKEKIERPPEPIYHTSLQHNFLECREGEEDHAKYRKCTFDLTVRITGESGESLVEDRPIPFFITSSKGDRQYASEINGGKSNHTYELNIDEIISSSSTISSCSIGIPELYWGKNEESTYCFPEISAGGSEWIQLEI